MYYSFLTKRNRSIKRGYWSAFMCFLLWCILLTSQQTNAQQQDTLFLKIEKLEEKFLKKNLGLLAASYDIAIADAAIIQAKAWPNPELSMEEIQLFKPADTDEIPGLFHSNFWKNRTFSIALEQKILLGGKRKFDIQQQIKEKEKTEAEFSMLLFALKKDLRNLIATWHFEKLMHLDIAVQYESIELLMRQKESLVKQGQSSRVELFRIKSLLHSIHKELKEKALSIQEHELQIKELLLIPLDQAIQLDTENFTFKKLIHQPIQELLALGKTHQKQFEWWQAHLASNRLQIDKEKAEAIPDLNLQMAYDRGGGTHLDFFGLGFAIDLPVFNRNKGNRKIAKWQLEKEEVHFKQFETNWEKQVRMTHQSWIQYYELLQNMDESYFEEIEMMTKALQQNLSARNLSLIEFLDYFEAFKESKEDYYQLQLSLYENQQTLYYLIGQDL